MIEYFLQPAHFLICVKSSWLAVGNHFSHMQQHTGKAGSIFLGKYYSFLGGVRGEWEDGRTRFQFSQVSEGRIFPQAMYDGCADLSRYTCTFTPLQCLSAAIFRGFFLVEIADL